MTATCNFTGIQRTVEVDGYDGVIQALQKASSGTTIVQKTASEFQPDKPFQLNREIGGWGVDVVFHPDQQIHRITCNVPYANIRVWNADIVGRAVPLSEVPQGTYHTSAVYTDGGGGFGIYNSIIRDCHLALQLSNARDVHIGGCKISGITDDMVRLYASQRTLMERCETLYSGYFKQKFSWSTAGDQPVFGGSSKHGPAYGWDDAAHPDGGQINHGGSDHTIRHNKFHLMGQNWGSWGSFLPNAGHPYTSLVHIHDNEFRQAYSWSIDFTGTYLRAENNRIGIAEGQPVINPVGIEFKNWDAVNQTSAPLTNDNYYWHNNTLLPGSTTKDPQYFTGATLGSASVPLPELPRLRIPPWMAGITGGINLRAHNPARTPFMGGRPRAYYSLSVPEESAPISKSDPMHKFITARPGSVIYGTDFTMNGFDIKWCLDAIDTAAIATTAVIDRDAVGLTTGKKLYLGMKCKNSSTYTWSLARDIIA